MIFFVKEKSHVRFPNSTRRLEILNTPVALSTQPNPTTTEGKYHQENYFSFNPIFRCSVLPKNRVSLYRTDSMRYGIDGMSQPEPDSRRKNKLRSQLQLMLRWLFNRGNFFSPPFRVCIFIKRLGTSVKLLDWIQPATARRPLKYSNPTGRWKQQCHTLKLGYDKYSRAYQYANQLGQTAAYRYFRKTSPVEKNSQRWHWRSLSANLRIHFDTDERYD